ncbi:hypothetical protein H0241_35135 [Mesorhizobium sp. CCANP35]|uniref:GAF domain-containing protein n=1 Tax=Mesorhizobium neociceri TaxID=1307853 RepID=A0A838BIV8_9HYPH|nr:hypothetical protein [Mesorhizobium neociceri]
MTISSLRSELTATREENQVRTAEITNLLEQQNATSAILRVIAASPTDIQSVLQIVAESAAHFCDTYHAGIFLAGDGTLFPKAHYGPIALDFGLKLQRYLTPLRHLVHPEHLRKHVQLMRRRV